jgi:hypothetical protein
VPFLAFLASPFGKYVGYAALALTLILGGSYALHEHDQRVLAEQAAKEAAVVAAQQIADAKKVAAAVQADAAAAIARATLAATVKGNIDHAPITYACAQSPAVRAALDGLPGSAGSSGGSAANPAKPVVLRPAAGGPKAAH